MDGDGFRDDWDICVHTHSFLSDTGIEPIKKALIVRRSIVRVAILRQRDQIHILNGCDAVKHRNTGIVLQVVAGIRDIDVEE